jgi:hypothetical protein
MTTNLHFLFPSALWWCLVAFCLILPSEVVAWTNAVFTRSHHHRALENTKLWAWRNWSAMPPIPIQDELGCSPTLTTLLNQPEPFFFDPLNLATDENFAVLREAELKHSRVAMIAVVWCILTTISMEMPSYIPMGKFEQLWLDIISLFDKSPTTTTTVVAPNEIVVQGPLKLQQLIPLPSPWNLLQDWSVWDYVGMMVVCGIVETFVWVQMDDQDMPGDYQVGYWGIRDKGRHERSLICELENGRLAMIVMLYYTLMDVWKVFSQAMI